MAFKGLFIGIDRYDSPEINWLSCASRDAKALHGLFTDTLGGETTLLTDEEATVAAIRQSFEALSTCDAEDVVVIAFSGHGTETHELVGHDADPYDLARTTIPLTMLGEWCSRIPSRRLLIVLDCCFSGGMGAKALQVEAVPRDIQSVDGKLNQTLSEKAVTARTFSGSRASDIHFECSRASSTVLKSAGSSLNIRPIRSRKPSMSIKATNLSVGNSPGLICPASRFSL
jgi:hypothetical protein